MSSNVLKARSAVGVATRKGDPTKLEAARRELAAAKLEQYIQRVISEAPPLDAGQRARLANIFGGGAK